MNAQFGPIKQAWLCRIAIAVIIMLTACKPQVTQIWPTEEIENHSSQLLTALMTEQDFSSEWLWSDTYTYQNVETPTPDNYQLVENAARSLTGRYGTEKIYIDLWHGLERYEQRSPSAMKSHLAEELHSTNPTVSSLSLPMVGQVTASECVRDPAYARVACRVVSRYNSIISVIAIYGPTTMDNKVIEQILGHELTTVDPRILGIDVQ